MRKIRMIRQILFHISMICSLICFTARILDWYNPYMNFIGSTLGFQTAAYLSVIALGFTRFSKEKKNKKRGENV